MVMYCWLGKDSLQYMTQHATNNLATKCGRSWNRTCRGTSLHGDRCVRLIRGVVRLFLERQWPASEFLSTFLTAEQFQRAIEEADRTRTGSRYIKWMCDLTTSDSETVDEVHAQILARYCTRPWK